MFCWHTIFFRVLAMVLLPGTLSVTHAQTVFRDLNLPQNQLQRTAVIGLLGEFVHCAAYEVADQDLDLHQVISQTQGLTPESSGIISVIRGGRISQNIYYSAGTTFPLMHGDVLIALKAPTNVVTISSDQRRNEFQRNQQQSAPELTQIAIINLLNRPVVFGVPPEIADLAGILHSLRQPLEKFPQIAQSIKVIPPQQSRNKADSKTKKLTSKFASGTVLVLNSQQSIDLSLVPHSLPTPRRLRSPLSTISEAPLETTTPVKEAAQQRLQRVTHPESISQPSEELPLKTKRDHLQLNGPLLQQTAASLTLVPQPNTSQPEDMEDNSPVKTGPQTPNPSAASTVPDVALKAAPAPPQESVHVLHDDDLSKLEESEKATSSSFLPQWSYYLFLAGIAAVTWKFLNKRSQTLQVSSRNHTRHKSKSSASVGSDANATIITDYDSLPPLPEKSLLEQILENKIPVIEETAQISTQTFIYGRHHTKSARIDQPETLKGPHFSRQAERESTVPEQRESTYSPPLDPALKPSENKLKAPAFRFDRSHPGSSQPLEEKTIHPKTSRPGSSDKKQAIQAKTNVNSGILDRVLHAVQGVINK